MVDTTIVAIVAAVDDLKKRTARQVCANLGGSSRSEVMAVSSGLAYLRKRDIIVGEGPPGRPSVFSPPTDRTAAQAFDEYQLTIARPGSGRNAAKPRAAIKAQAQQSGFLLGKIW